jgi:hypothetical protein
MGSPEAGSLAWTAQDLRKRFQVERHKETVECGREVNTGWVTEKNLLDRLRVTQERRAEIAQGGRRRETGCRLALEDQMTTVLKSAEKSVKTKETASLKRRRQLYWIEDKARARMSTQFNGERTVYNWLRIDKEIARALRILTPLRQVRLRPATVIRYEVFRGRGRSRWEDLKWFATADINGPKEVNFSSAQAATAKTQSWPSEGKS